MKNIGPSKSHGWDNLSVRMIYIYKASFQEGTFPSCWKKADVAPVHKNEVKTLLKNYKPISLPPIFGKIFDNTFQRSIYLIFTKMNFLQNASLDFYMVILASHSCYLLFTISILLLTVIQLSMSEVYS